MPRISKPPEARKQEILDVASRLFEERGFQNTTVSDIVREVGVAQGLFYYYFKNKEEVMVAVMLRYAQDFIESARATIADKSEPPMVRIQKVASAIPQILTSRDAFYGQIKDQDRQQALDQFIKMTVSVLQPYVTELIEEGNQAGDFNVPHPAHVANFLLSGFVGLSVGPPFIAADAAIEMIHVLCERVLELPKGALMGAIHTEKE